MKGYSTFPQTSKAEALPSDGLMSYPGHLLLGGAALCIDAFSVFYSPSRLEIPRSRQGTEKAVGNEADGNTNCNWGSWAWKRD